MLRLLRPALALLLATGAAPATAQAPTSDARWWARNDAQGLDVRHDPSGFRVTPADGAWSWGLELSRWGRAASPARAVPAGGACLTLRRAGGLDEWLVNDERGLEHGFTLRLRPAGDEPLRLTLAVRGGLEPRVDPGGLGARFLDARGLSAVTYTGLAAFDADGARLDARLALEAGALVLSVDERDARYPLTIDPLIQQAYLKASTPGLYDGFGEAVAVSGDTVVVGSPREDSGSTGVNGPEGNHGVGDSGAAYVLVRSGGAWSQQAYLKASNTTAEDSFGEAVAISGDTIVVGAPEEDSDATGVNGDQSNDDAHLAGAAYVFVRDGTTWSQQAYLKASNTELLEAFGRAVAISGDTIVVGAPEEDSDATGVDGDQASNAATLAGAAYVFRRSGTTWTQEAYLKASNTGDRDLFGFAVAIDGDTIVVGAQLEDSAATGVGGDGTDDSADSAGAAYVFTRSGTTWSQQAYLKASNTGAGDVFGEAVAVCGDTVVVGANLEDSAATSIDGDGSDDGAQSAGAAYVFRRDAGVWSQVAYLKAWNAAPSVRFGGSVAVSGNAVLVGASEEHSPARGLNGSQVLPYAFRSGAGYLFVESGSGWVHDTWLKASNADAGDAFGTAVGVSGDTLIVGAPGESSDASGVDGDQHDNSLVTCGAAYVFTRTHEAVRVGTPPNPAALLPGATGGPTAGLTWEPRIDHSTFLPAAAFDFLGLSTAPLEIPTEFGTLLATPAPFTFVNAAGAPFLLTIPLEPSLVSVPLFTQGASWDGTGPVDGASLRLTNALDIAIGAP
jgi:hypothetical protein